MNGDGKWERIKNHQRGTATARTRRNEMKTTVWNIVVNVPGCPYEIVAGPFASKIDAESFANSEPDLSDGEGGTIADGIQSGMYRYSQESVITEEAE